MALLRLLPFAAAVFSLLLAGASLVRKRGSYATWFFSLGMVLLGADSVLAGLSLQTAEPAALVRWQTLSLIVKSTVPVVWLAFSLAYSRGDRWALLRRWRVPLAVFGVLPIAIALGFRGDLLQLVQVGPDNELWLRFGLPARVLNVLLLIGAVLVLMNMEQTYRSAVGTMRWRLKYVVLAMAAIFGARLYVRSQAVLFSAPDLAMWSVESGALLIGCVFFAVAYARSGLAEVDVYPSLAAIRSSVTLVLVGGYLFVVGVLAQVARGMGGAASFQVQALIVLAGVAVLGVLLLSDRVRRRIRDFVVRHFKTARHDSLRVWTLFSQRLGSARDQGALASVAARLVAETFDVLSVSVWLVNDKSGEFALSATTASRSVDASLARASRDLVDGLRSSTEPFDLERADAPWADELRRLNPSTFPNGGSRWALPLRASEKCLGVVILADRVGAALYAADELQLLACIGDHVTAGLANLKLANDLASARELEAFRTMSAFFVHDLKNAASSLNLMLKNLPVHFDDPEFRKDALRAVGNTARRIEDMITGLGSLRQPSETALREMDLNAVVADALDGIVAKDMELVRELTPLPIVLADRAQLGSVVTNLVLNARDAAGPGGRIEVRTTDEDGRAVVSVTDNGCGMSPAFLKESLFRPFQSTKKNGLGIGMFQAKMVVERHGGRLEVESEVGRGTTFRVSLPASGRESPSKSLT